MATEGGVALPVQPTSKSPYQLDLTQTTQACSVLIKHIADERKRREGPSSKPNLLSKDEDESEDEDAVDLDDEPIWLILTTKKHVTDKKKLKPGKIPLPHSINTSSTSSICLIAADPQRGTKDVLASPAFPAALRARITRVIGLSKLKSRYHTFEARRQLLAEHDIFLADDRVVTYLPQLLGKVFFKGGSKRPVPVSLAAPTKDAAAGPKAPKQALAPRKAKDAGSSWVPLAPEAVAREIERALGAALVHLAPAATTAVKVGKASFAAEMVAANVDAVVKGLTEKYVTKGWRNIRAVHIKGPKTMAFPVWLASELWMDEEDIKEDAIEEKNGEAKAIENGASGKGKKRKAGEGVGKPDASARHAKKKRKAAEKLASEMSARKQNMKKQKAEIMSEALRGDE